LTGLRKFSTSENPKYPVPGDVDVFSRDCPDPIEVSQGKVKVKTTLRWLSVFESQLRPIADWFEENPEAPTLTVRWISATNVGGRPITVAQIQKEM